jgi:hypothetical protein
LATRSASRSSRLRQVAFSFRSRRSCAQATSSLFPIRTSTPRATSPCHMRAWCPHWGRCRPRWTTIVDRIKNRAIEPQAVVALVNQNTSLISVLGEVNTPGRFPTATEGEHLLDTIAKAGRAENHRERIVGDARAPGTRRDGAVPRAGVRAGQQYLVASLRHHLSLSRAANVPRIWSAGTAGPVQLRRLAHPARRGSG